MEASERIIPLPSKPSVLEFPKDETKSLRLKQQAAERFRAKDFSGAIRFYSESIAYAPSSCHRLIAVVLTNRSWANHRLSHTHAALSDVISARNVDPSYMKACLRQCQYLCALKRHDDAVAVATDAELRLIATPAECGDVTMTEFREALSGTSHPPPATPLPAPAFPSTPLPTTLSLVQTDSAGRDVRALQAIPPGTELWREAPIAVSLLCGGDLRCGACLAEIGPGVAIVVCPDCSGSKYCSEDCRTRHTYAHVVECGCPRELYSKLLPATRLSLATLSTHLRTISPTRDIHELVVSEFPPGSPTETVGEGVEWCQGDMHCLEGHWRGVTDSDRELLLSQADIACAVAWKCMGFSGESRSECSRALWRGCLASIMRVRINSFTIRAISCSGESRDGVVSSLHENGIACGVFSLASMLNHSCEPNSIVGFDGAVITVRTCATVRTGDSVRISYGPRAGHSSTETRQRSTFERYGFVCQCPACQRSDEGMGQLIRCERRECQGEVRLMEDIQTSTCRTCKRALNPDRVLLLRTLPKRKDTVEQKVMRLVQCGAQQQAITLAEQWLSETEALFVPPNLVIAEAHDNLARISAITGDFSRAATHATANFTTVCTLFGPQSIEAMHEGIKLAQILMNSRSLAELRAVVRDVLPLAKTHLGVNHSDTQELQMMFDMVLR